MDSFVHDNEDAVQKKDDAEANEAVNEANPSKDGIEVITTAGGFVKAGEELKVPNVTSGGVAVQK